jgi:hypothetical protein
MDGGNAAPKQKPTILTGKKDGVTFEMSVEIDGTALEVFETEEMPDEEGPEAWIASEKGKVCPSVEIPVQASGILKPSSSIAIPPCTGVRHMRPIQTEWSESLQFPLSMHGERSLIGNSGRTMRTRSQTSERRTSVMDRRSLRSSRPEGRAKVKRFVWAEECQKISYNPCRSRILSVPFDNESHST